MTTDMRKAAAVMRPSSAAFVGSTAGDYPQTLVRSCGHDLGSQSNDDPRSAARRRSEFERTTVRFDEHLADRQPESRATLTADCKRLAQRHVCIPFEARTVVGHAHRAAR